MESTPIYYYAIGLTVDTTIDFALSLFKFFYLHKKQLT